MANTDYDAVRLSIPGNYCRQELPIVSETPLPMPSRIDTSFVVALTQRRSADAFKLVPFAELGAWLYYTASIQAFNSDDHNRQRRFVGSFGALHPAHIVLGTPDGIWNTYLPDKHALGQIDVDVAVGTKLRGRAQEYFYTDTATLIVLVSDMELSSNYYENPEKLVLRDASVLLGHSALVAAAIGLGFRVLGGTGTPFAEDLIRAIPFTPVATGLAWVGGLP